MIQITKAVGRGEIPSVLRAVSEAIIKSPSISGLPQIIEVVPDHTSPTHLSITADVDYVRVVEAAIPMARQLFEEKSSRLTTQYSPMNLFDDMTQVITDHIERSLGSVAYRAGIATREVFRDAL
jgi:hypothetical protein